MAVRVTLEFVLKEMDENDLTYFKLKDGNSLIYQQDKNISLSEAKSILRDTVDSLDGDLINIELYNKNNKTLAQGGKDYQKRSFTIRLNSARGIAGIGAGGAGNEKLLREISELNSKLVRQEFERKFDDLKRSLEDKPDTITSLIQGITPYLPKLLGMDVPAAATLAGPPAEPQQVTVEEYKQRINAALRKLAVIDNEYVVVLEALAELATNDPASYNMYRPMLINFKKQ